VAIAIAFVLLNEVPPALAIAGGLACIVGVIVARSSPRVVAVAQPAPAAE
jgi:hypothetical protein